MRGLTETRVLALAAVALLAAPPLDAQEEAYPTEPPPPMEAEDVDLPELGRDTLENGLELVVVENREQPVVSVRLYVPGGSVADPDGASGVAALTSRALDKGTGERTAGEIAAAVEGVGASLNTGAADDYAFVATSALTRHLPTVLEVFSDVVKNATFPDSEVANERKRMQASLQQELSQPAALASRHFDRIVYGDHPYGDAPTPASVASIERERLARFHRERYVPEGSLLVFAGDIDLDAARQAAERWFGDWSGERPRDAELPEPPSRDSARIYLVHRPGSEQSVVRVGHLGIRPGSEDAHALEVANRVLGGGANARLFLILREEKGWTYGAYSELTQRRGIGTFGAQAEVRNPVTDSALNEMIRQIRRLRQEPVSGEEMTDARTYLTGNFPLRLETPQQVATRVADVLLRGLEVGYLESYRSRIAEVTAGDVQRAAREHLHPDRAAVVVVGDATRVRDDLAAIGPVEMYDTEGQPLALADLEVKRSDVSLDPARIRTGTLTYRLAFQGNAVGTMTFRAEEAGDGRWRVRQDLEAGPGRQSIEYTVARGFDPLSITQSGEMGPVSQSRDLAYDDGRVTGTATVPRESGGGQQGQQQGPPEMEQVTVDTAVAPGTIDENMDLGAILSAPLEQGAEFSVPVFSPTSGVTRLTARVTGTETVTVPAGEFEAWVVEVTRRQQPITLHVTRDAPRMMLRQQAADRPLTVELESVGGGGVTGDGSSSGGDG